MEKLIGEKGKQYWMSDSEEGICNTCLRAGNDSEYTQCQFGAIFKAEFKENMTRCGRKDDITGNLLYVSREKSKDE